MAPIKFVIKCGNFAVLVDLHVLPQGPKESTDWFTATQTEEVTALVRDAVDQRVKQYVELLHNRRQRKHKKELPPASAFSATESGCKDNRTSWDMVASYTQGVTCADKTRWEKFNLVANFLKRHSSLRCAVKRDLRLFPERYVVCVSCPEDALANHRNPSLAAMEQTRSEYFSSAGGTQEFLHDLTKTKKSALQKIAKQANVQQTSSGFTEETERSDQEARPERKAGERKASWRGIPTAEQETPCCSSFQAENQTLKPEGEPEVISERLEPTGDDDDDDEDPHLQPAKRPCLGGPPGTTRAHSAETSSQTSIHDLPPLQVKTESKETTLEVELLRLPLTSNNTAPTIQNRLAASLRGLSVKPASSGSSIGSRSTLREERSQNVPRTSRLRRTKRS